jgi:hypothetical protein
MRLWFFRVPNVIGVLYFKSKISNEPPGRFVAVHPTGPRQQSAPQASKQSVGYNPPLPKLHKQLKGDR